MEFSIFLSGLSIIGIVLTLYWDKKQEVDKEKKTNIDRMSYLYSVCHKANTMLQEYESAFKKFNEELNENPFNIPKIRVGSSMEILKVVNEKIDQEAYFHSYKSFYDDEQILDLFNHYASIAIKVKTTLEDIEIKSEFNTERNNLLLNLMGNLVNYLKGFVQNNTNDDFISLSKNLISSLDNLDKKLKSDAWTIYNTLSKPTEIYVNMPGGKNKEFVEYWNIIKNKVIEIEENNKNIIQITKSYSIHTGNCLKEITPILEKINTRKVSDSESSFWYFFHGKPKTH